MVERDNQTEKDAQVTREENESTKNLNTEK